MGRDTKAVGKLGKKRRPKGATAKPRSAPKAERGRRSSGANRESKVARLTRELGEALQRQAATADILKVIASSPTDTQPVFEAIVLTAVRLLRCDMSFVILCDPPAFWVAAAATPEGLFDELTLIKEPIDPSANFPSRAIVEKRGLYLPDWSLIDLPEHERHIHETVGVNSALYLPLMREGECIGLLTLGGKQANIFGESEIALAESFRDQALIAIENARLFNETKEALERQTATADILKVIASSPSDVQPVFDAIAERSKRLVDALSTTVFRLDDGLMHLRAFTPTNPEADATLKAMFPAPLSSFSWGEAVRNGDIFRVVDTEREMDGLRDLARLRGFRSMLFVPLLRDRTPIGLIAVTRVQPGTFVEHHVQLLRTFADQAVIAIENVRLFDEVQAKTHDLMESLQQQTATADVLKVISRSAFDLDVVLNSLTKSAVELCNSTYGAISLYRDGVLVFMAQTGCTPEFAELLWSHPAPLDRKSVTGRTGLLRSVVQVPDVVQDEDYDYHGGEIIGNYRSCTGVPLLRNGELEGVFTLMRREPGNFTPRQVELVQTFADQAVIAIENVRLFDEVQARTKELAASLEELRTAQDRLVQTEKLASLGQLTAGIAHEIKNPLNFVNNFSALSAELIDELDETLAPAPLDRKMRGDVGELTQMLKSNLEKVVQHGKRADSIVKNMLLHSREGSGEHRSADINALVEESLNLAYHGARAEKPGFTVTLQRDLDPDAGAVELYQQEITRALLNLISNGFYAATQRKSVEGETFEPLLIAATKSLGKAVEIRIRDNGTGIPPEVMEKIFNPFFTTKPAGEGTGLGLSMSHDIIVKQHGGRIDVETSPGQFTEFRIVLPRTANFSKQD
jgi:two-component system, NtrC family, sensor kinase